MGKLSANNVKNKIVAAYKKTPESGVIAVFERPLQRG